METTKKMTLREAIDFIVRNTDEIDDMAHVLLGGITYHTPEADTLIALRSAVSAVGEAIRTSETTETTRMFDLYEFKDKYDSVCSIQDSSLATDYCIWLGVNDADPKILVPDILNEGKGWQPVIIPGLHTTTRMHLTRQQATNLIPYLLRFIVTGSIGWDTEVDEEAL
jgi:hypothetical protein